MGLRTLPSQGHPTPPTQRSKGIHTMSQPAKTTAQGARFSPTFRHAKINVTGITPSTFAKWAPVLAVWGVGAGAAVVLLASDIPRFKRDVLDKVPVVREYLSTRPRTATSHSRWLTLSGL